MALALLVLTSRYKRVAAMTILQSCLDFMRLSEAAESETRKKAVAALRFASGENQWPESIQVQRDLENRPCLTINKTDAFCRQVINQMRQQRPRMVVHPVGDGADVDKAEVIQGVLRHIEVNSNADIAYDTANEYQVRAGRGYWRVTHRHISETSFDQDIYIDPIDNPLTVFWDPSSTSPDGLDAEQVLVVTMMSRAEFKRRWPNADQCDFNSLSEDASVSDWATEKEIRVGEYWVVEKAADVLVEYSNGWSGFKSKLSADVVKSLNLTVVRERPTYRRQVRMHRCSARDVLESKDWAGRFIPIVPVYGNRINVDGDIQISGMVENLVDPQRMYNFWRTSEAEIVALAPKAPWVMAEGQDEGHEAEWETANVKSYSSLKYKPIEDAAGNMLPPPQRQAPQQIPAANVTAANNAAEDMKAVAGIFDASMGDREQDPSGVALSRHQMASEISTFQFYDNACRSVRATGIICLDLMPAIYGPDRVMRIIGEDGQAESVTLNERKKDEAGVVQEVLNDVSVGRYDVVMDTGPGYNTKRIESADNMLKLLGTPLGEKIAQVADDVVVRHFDWTGARDLADRLAAANPLAQAEQMSDLPPEAQQMIKQMQGQVQQLQQALQEAELEKKYRLEQIRLKEHAADGRHLVTEKNENDRLHFREKQENTRHEATLVTKTHDIAMRDATKRHDVEFKASTALSIAEINAIAALMGKHIDGSHLMAEIEAEDRRTAELATQNEPVTS